MRSVSHQSTPSPLASAAIHSSGDGDLPSLVERGAQARERADYTWAERLLREAVERAEVAQPAQPRTLAAALNAFGMLCKDLGRHDEGRASYERALRLLEETPAASPHDVATIYHNLAGIMHARGDYAGAEPVARHGLALRLGAPESKPSAVVADRIALAGILEGVGSYAEAATQCREALALMATLPDDVATAMAGEFAVALNNLGTQYARQGRYAEATELMERALRVKRGLLGDEHPDVALSLHNLATVWMRRGEAERALPMFIDERETFTRALGASHRKTFRAAEALERCRAALVPRFEAASLDAVREVRED